GLADLNYVRGRLHLPGDDGALAIFLQWHFDAKASHTYWSRLRFPNPSESFSEPGTVQLAVSDITEFITPKESKGTDCFTEIQAALEVPRQKSCRIIASNLVAQSLETPRYYAGFG